MTDPDYEVLMFTTTRTFAVMLAVGGVASHAAAQAPQIPPPTPTAQAQPSWPAAREPRFVFSVNGLAETGSQNLSTTTPIQLYEETGSYTVDRRVTGGGAWDLGFTARIGRRWGVGVGFTASTDSGTANVSGQVPHPLFFDRLRSFSFEEADLDQREQSVHFQATWAIPITNRWGATLFAGPSILNVSQDQVTEVQFTEVGPPYATVNAIPVRGKHSGTGAGFNIGADTTYVVLTDLGFLHALGLGATLRYAGGSVDVEQAGGAKAKVDVGGFQIGGGLRVLF